MAAGPAAVGSRRVSPRRFVELVVTLAARALKVRYRGSVLGVYWSLGNPLLMTGIYTLIFGTAFSKYYGNSVAEYTLAVFVGLTVLTFFTTSTTQALASVVTSGGLLNKIEIPFSVFPLSYIAANAFQLAVGTVPLLVGVTLWRTHSLGHLVALCGPLGGLLLTSTGFALATSALYVFFRDLPYLYELFSFMLYMTSPIFYPLDIVPASVRGWMLLNPLTGVVEATRAVALQPGPIPFGAALTPLGIGAAIAAAGAVVFSLVRHDFMDLL